MAITRDIEWYYVFDYAMVLVVLMINICKIMLIIQFFFAITEFISVFPGGLCQVERITVLSDYYVHR